MQRTEVSTARQSARTSVATVLRFVDRTVSHGVPVRVAISRAAKRYRMAPELIRAFYRGEA